MIGSFNKALTVGLLEGLMLKHWETSCRNPLLHVEGRGEYAPLTIFIESMCKLGASKGGLSAISSYNMTPIDHTSVLKVYG